MKKLSSLFVISMTLLMGFSAVAFGQSTTNTSDIIENMRVIKIESVEVQPLQESAVHYLNVIVELKNENDKDIKLTDSEFEFFIHDKEHGPKDVGIASCIINLQPDDKKENFICPGTKEEILLPSQQSVRVLFAVEMGRKRPVLETVIDILNFIGKPTEGRSFLIKGRFDLGIKSSRGWSYGEAVRVEWGFCPDIQNELPLHECLVE